MLITRNRFTSVLRLFFRAVAFACLVFLGFTGSNSRLLAKPAGSDGALSARLDAFARELAKPLLRYAPVRVAVFDFSQDDGTATKLDRYLGEAVISTFGKIEGLVVLDRSAIASSRGQEPSSPVVWSGDAKRMRRLRRDFTVKAAVTGVWSLVGRTVRVEARTIRTKNSDVVGSASIVLDLDELGGLLGTPQQAPHLDTQPQKDVSLSPPRPEDYRRGERVYYEDFSGVDEGVLPTAWQGSDLVMVGIDGTSKALVLSDHAKHQSAVSPPISFPENFEIELRMTNKRCGDNVLVNVGTLAFGHDCYGVFNSTTDGRRDHVGGRSGGVLGSFARFSFKKTGDVYDVWVNDVRKLLKRISKATPPSELRIFLSGRKHGVKLFEVSVYELVPGQ